MKLHEIVEFMDEQTQAAQDGECLLLEYGLIAPYKLSLKTYYTQHEGWSEVIFMSMSVTNNSAYGLLVSAEDFQEVLTLLRTEEDDQEVVSAQSFVL